MQQTDQPHRTRRARRWLRGALAGAALAVGGAVAGLDTVDTTPCFRTAYHAETRARLAAPAARPAAAHGALSAGFGRVRLTPTLGADPEDPRQGRFRAVPLAGYSSRRGQPAASDRGDLWVKAVALRVADTTGVMVGVDALIVPAEVTALVADRLAAEAGLRREQIFLSATHTHSSLGGWGQGWVAELFAGGFRPGVREWIAECIVRAVQAALRDLQPAAFGHGSFAAPQFVRNRLVGDLGGVDPEFNYAVVRQRTGRTAVLGVYGAHATVLPADRLEFSGDYPGAWQEAVEAATGGLALFLAGGVGSHGPVVPGKGAEPARALGAALAQRLLERLAETPVQDTVGFAPAGLEVTLPSLHLRVSDGLRLRPWLAAQVLPDRGRTFLQAWRLNDSVWISTPADFSGELARPIKDSLRARGLAAAITSFNGDYVGYVIPARYYHLAAYESRTMSFYGPHLADYFDELIRALALGVATGL